MVLLGSFSCFALSALLFLLLCALAYFFLLSFLCVSSFSLSSALSRVCCLSLSSKLAVNESVIFVSKVANVIASDWLVILVKDCSSCGCLRFPSNASWFRFCDFSSDFAVPVVEGTWMLDRFHMTSLQIVVTWRIILLVQYD